MDGSDWAIWASGFVCHLSGDTIIKEGGADRNLFKFYIIEEGEARAYVLEEGEEVLMSHLGPGGYWRFSLNASPRYQPITSL